MDARNFTLILHNFVYDKAWLIGDIINQECLYCLGIWNVILQTPQTLIYVTWLTLNPSEVAPGITSLPKSFAPGNFSRSKSSITSLLKT